jgi:hypothetical protein
VHFLKPFKKCLTLKKKEVSKMNKLISRCLIITCCVILVGGLLSTIYAAEIIGKIYVPTVPAISITTLSPKVASTWDKRTSFVAVIGGTPKFPLNMLELDDVVVIPKVMTYTDASGQIKSTVSYTPSRDLDLGVHTYVLRLVYAGHKVTQSSSFIVQNLWPPTQ